MPSTVGTVIKGLRTVLRFLVLGLVLAGTSAADAASLSVEVQKGLAWLQAQVQADGSLVGESASIATPFQARSEAAQTIQLLTGQPSSALSAALRVDPETTTEHLARRLLDAPDAAALATLLARQGADGGWGGADGYVDNPLDSAFALLALKGQGVAVPDGVVSRTLAFLGSCRSADGTWSPNAPAGPLGSRVHTTSVVVLAAQAWMASHSVGTLTVAGRDGLLSLRGGSAYADTLDNAVGLSALVTQTSSPDILQPLADALRAAQGAQGDWAGDPFLTALALRALWAAEAAPAPGSTGAVTGRAVDAASAPLAGATVRLLEVPDLAVTTDTDGYFSLTGVAAGAYTLQVAKVGHESLSIGIQVDVGRTTSVGTVQIAAATLTATVTGTVKVYDSPFAGALISVGSTSTTSDAKGQYILTGILPGRATIIASKSPYPSVTSQPVDFEAGKVYNFSPTFYNAGTTPPATQLKGKVVDAVTSAAITGARVAVGGISATTAANGTFNLTGLTTGNFSLAISAPGYADFTASGTLAAGVNDVGNLAMAKLAPAATVNLSGRVTDAQTGVGLAGATVSAQGRTATADVSGAYALADVGATSFDLVVGASGYLTSTRRVSVAQPGNAVVDIALIQAQASAIAIDAVTPGKASYLPTETLQVAVTLRNSGDQAVDVVVDALVLDANNSLVLELKANAHGLGNNPPNLPVSVSAASTSTITLEELLLRQAAGTYRILVRAYDVMGRTIAEGTGTFSVGSQAVFGGGLIVDPPLSQAGAQTPIRFLGQLSNLGNEAIPTGDLTLTVTLDNPDTQSPSQARTNAKTVVAGAPLINLRGLANDAEGNLYTVSSGYNDGRVFRVAPDGSVTVAVQIPTGAPYYPALSDVVRDAQGNFWVASGSTGTVWMVDRAGTITRIDVPSLSLVGGIDIDANGVLYLTGQWGVEHRLVKRETNGSQAVVWANGLSSPFGLVRDNSGDFVVTNNTDNTLVKVNSSGEIKPFVSGLDRPKGITKDAAGNFYVANNGNHSVVKVTPDGVKSVYATGMTGVADLRFDPNGNLFVSCQGDNTIRKVAPDGSVSVFSRGIALWPIAMRYDASGNLLIANQDGTLRRLDNTGHTSERATGLGVPRGMAIDGAGSIFVTNESSGTITKLNGTDKSTFASGLSNPAGVATDGAGNVLVAESGSSRLSKFDANGTLLERIVTFADHPSAAIVDGRDNVVIASNNLLTIIEAGQPRVFSTGISLRVMAPDPSGDAVIGVTAYDVYRLTYDGRATKLKTLPFYAYGIAADGMGNLVFADYSGRKIYRMDPAGSLTLLATPVSNPRYLVGDGKGKLYALLSDNTVVSVAADGAISHLTSFYVAPTWESPYGLSIAADGSPLVWSGMNRVVAVNPTTGALSVVKSGIQVSGVTVDSTGKVYTTHYNENEFAVYDPTGALVARWTGFVGLRDVVWDGAQYWFSDASRTYSLAAGLGQYPVRKAHQTMNALAVSPSSGELLGVNGGGVYRWTGSSYVQVATVAGVSNLRAIAVNSDNTVTVADTGTSRVVSLGAGYAVKADYAGIQGPIGLAFDTAGNLYVASISTGAIARFAAGAAPNSAPMLFARVGYPGWLSFDAQGKLWVTDGSRVHRVEPDGSVTQVSDGTTMASLFLDGTTPFGVGTNGNQLYRWDGSQWVSFAAGMLNPEGLRITSDGGIVVANRGNGTLVKWLGGTLDVLAGGLASPHDVDVAADGSGYFVSGDQGKIFKIGLDGRALNLDEATVIGNQVLSGLTVGPDGKVFVATSSYSGGSIAEVYVAQPVVPPPAGTVVHQATVSALTIEAGAGVATIDMGSWTPPYGGDFSVRVSRAGIVGELASSFHVGPFAKGTRTTSTPRVGPGSRTVPLQFNITGADFSSVARVETALIKPTVTGVRPNGMVADRAGNIYVTDGSTLRKISPTGLETIVASGYTFGFGLGIDSAERLYVLARVGSTMQLLRFTTDGQALVSVANVGATAIGVAINSRDEIFVGAPGQLLQVSQDGATRIYSSMGIPNPVGISIDGKDNIYVQNTGHLITQIKPDRSATVIYNKADGVDHPQFEYEGLALAADCSDNIYLAPVVWKKVDQVGEEYTLVQVNPRTGQVSVVLDGRKIHYDLTDMDYLVFDRFGSRILIWTDYSGGRIWQVPVTCGAISVDAHLVTKPGQTLTGMGRAPVATVLLANGGTEYVWSLRDVTAEGVSFGFDTVLEGLALGETRSVVDRAFLQFKNSFSPNDVNQPLTVPVVQVDNLVGLAVGTDQPSYPVNSTAMVGVQLNNTQTVDVTGLLVVDVVDAAGVAVARVIQQAALIAAGGRIEVRGDFLIGTTVPGAYSARATLSDNGVTLAEGAADFSVVSDGTATTTATSQLFLDKASYQATDRASITSRAINSSANVVLKDLTLSIAITDPSGGMVFTKDVAIAELPAGATREWVTQYPFSGAAAGTYTVAQTLKDATGAVLDSQSKTYQVTDSSATGFGLAGTLTANPKEVVAGNPVALAFTASNQGNAGYSGLPLTVRILNPASSLVLAQFPSTIDLAAGGSYAASQSWPTQGQAPATLVAALSAMVGGREIALAQDTFRINPVPVTLEYGATFAQAGRVLVLAACSGHGEGNEDGHGGHHGHHGDGEDDPDNSPQRDSPSQGSQGHSGHGGPVISRPGHPGGRTCDEEGDGHDDSPDDSSHGGTCGLGRAEAIDDLLIQLGVDHRVTTDPAIFRQELRSGAYNTYWVSGEVSKLHDDLAEEIREAVFRGDSLILDGVHDQRNKTLEETIGAEVRGKTGARDQPLWLAAPVFDGRTVGTAGQGLRLTVAGGQVLGRFGGTGGQPAVVGNPHGQGRALLFGIDLVASLPADGTWPTEAELALAHLLPPWPDRVGAGAYVPLAVTLKNAGDAANVELRLTLPAGAQFIAAQPAPDDPGTPLVWRLAMGAASEQTVQLALRAPLVDGVHAVTIEAGTLVNGVFTASGAAQTLAFEVHAAAGQLGTVKAQIEALAVAKRDRAKRDQAARDVGQAQAAIAAKRWSQAIEGLLDAIGWLKQIASPDPTALRLALDQALRDVQWRWATAQ